MQSSFVSFQNRPNRTRPRPNHARAGQLFLDRITTHEIVNYALICYYYWFPIPLHESLCVIVATKCVFIMPAHLWDWKYKQHTLCTQHVWQIANKLCEKRKMYICQMDGYKMRCLVSKCIGILKMQWKHVLKYICLHKTLKMSTNERNVVDSITFSIFNTKL